MFDEEIIHVLMLKESATQKPTKFQAPHCRRSGSTSRHVSKMKRKYEEDTNRLEIMVEEHKLSRREVWLTLDGELVAPVGHFGVLDLLHDFAVEEKTFVA